MTGPGSAQPVEQPEFLARGRRRRVRGSGEQRSRRGAVQAVDKGKVGKHPGADRNIGVLRSGPPVEPAAGTNHPPDPGRDGRPVPGTGVAPGAEVPGHHPVEAPGLRLRLFENFDRGRKPAGRCHRPAR